MTGIQGPDQGHRRNDLYLASLGNSRVLVNGVVENGSSTTMLPQTPFTSRPPRRQFTRQESCRTGPVRLVCAVVQPQGRGFNASQRSTASMPFISLPKGGSHRALLVIC